MSGATRHAGVRKRFVGRLFVPALLIMVLAVVLAGCGRGVPTTTTQTVTTVTSTNTSSPATSPVTTSSVPQVSSTSTSAATTTTLLTSSTTTTGSGDELSTAETSLPNGHIKAMGFIKRVWMGGTRTDGGTRRLEIDYAEMLTGAAADAAAAEAGLISPGEHVDNDYFIRNVNPMLRTFTLSSAATFFDDTGVTGVPITWETFLGYWTGDPAGAAHKRAAPWWIERDGSTVLKVNQQYLP